MYIFLVCNVAYTLSAGDCEDNTVRLVDGRTNMQTQTMDGRLEICINNAWGSICNNSFRLIDAEVACNHVFGFERMGEFNCINTVSKSEPTLVLKLLLTLTDLIIQKKDFRIVYCIKNLQKLTEGKRNKEWSLFVLFN